MNDVFKPSGQNSTTARASLLKLNNPFRKTNCGQNSLSYIAPNTWNKLPDSLKITEKLNTYKHRVKKHFFIDWIIRKTEFIVTSDVAFFWLTIVKITYYYFLSF